MVYKADNKDDLDKVFQFLNKNTPYKGFEAWFYNKVCNDLDNRMVCYLMENDVMIGAAICKKSEKKICCIYIAKEYQHNQYGQILLEECFNYLNTRKPYITISKQCFPNFKRIIQENKWSLDKVEDKEYGHVEYYYNLKGGI
jgi:ribosomal protein S18 acetylase RimI-like enzyme